MTNTEEDWGYVTYDYDSLDHITLDELIDEGCINISRKQYREMTHEDN